MVIFFFLYMRKHFERYLLVFVHTVAKGIEKAQMY